MNSARQRIASLVRQYNTAEAMHDAEKATNARRMIYQILADTIRFIEKLSRAAPEMRDDHAWAYHSLAALNTIDEGETTITAGVKDVMASVANNFLPRTSAEVVTVPTEEPKRFGCDDDQMDAPVGRGALMSLLGRLGVFRSGYSVAQTARNTARCQDFRVAMYNQLGSIQAYVTSTASRLTRGLRDRFMKDWNWLESARDGLLATLGHEGMQSHSLEPLDEAETLPENCIPWAEETDSPIGLWGSLIETDMQEATVTEELTTRQHSWAAFICSFRPGAAMVTIVRDIELRPAGDGGAFAFHAYAECGWLHRVHLAGAEEWVGQRAWIEHWECPKCRQPIPQEATGTCPRCQCRMGQSAKASAVPARKAYIPLECLPLNNETVPCNARAALHAGAWREVVVHDGREGMIIHPDKAEAKTRKGPKVKGLIQIQWLDTGGISRIPEAEQYTIRREIFVYQPARMETTLGTAHFCFGAWVEFEAVEIPDTTNRFRIGDTVAISDPILIRKSKLWGASSGKDRHTDRLRNEGVGEIVRAPSNNTSEEAAGYDVKIGGFVLLGQQDDDLRPANGETNRILEPELEERAGEFVNIFEAKAYDRYRKSGRGRPTNSIATL